MARIFQKQIDEIFELIKPVEKELWETNRRLQGEFKDYNEQLKVAQKVGDLAHSIQKMREAAWSLNEFETSSDSCSVKEEK